MSRAYYADGVPYTSMRAMANAVGIDYQAIYYRFKFRTSFLMNDIFFSKLALEHHEAERAKVDKFTWKPSHIEPSSRRMVNEKPAPLLGHGYITHGVNNMFGR